MYEMALREWGLTPRQINEEVSEEQLIILFMKLGERKRFELEQRRKAQMGHGKNAPEDPRKPAAQKHKKVVKPDELFRTMKVKVEKVKATIKRRDNAANS